LLGDVVYVIGGQLVLLRLLSVGDDEDKDVEEEESSTDCDGHAQW